MKKYVKALFLLGCVWCAFPAAAGVAGTDVIEANVVGPAIEFGQVAVGSSAQTVIGGTNNSPYVMNVYAALGGPDAGEFSVINNCSGIPLVPGATCTGTIGFNPHSPGPKKAELILVLRGTQNVGVIDTSQSTILDVNAPPAAVNHYLRVETMALSGTGK